ncbi:unnamed protein product [Angiostrongylus costaricensis]|uniref:AAA_lid_6 domain-containing protein n=1 Tax=Angiostrongylus costaricensis TaxID=334426 RepID=A0A0R3PIX6_ANGCS|nr:unnamed protein product [Angiostrongylus costaricensis]
MLMVDIMIMSGDNNLFFFRTYTIAHIHTYTHIHHALSYGWLVDQIIRRTDIKHRGIGQFFKEEIADKHKLEFHFGLPMEKAWRVARITQPTLIGGMDEFLTDPNNVDYALIFKQYLRG